MQFLSQDYFQDRTLHKEVRYDCPLCGETRRRLYVKYYGGYWKWHCHNCGVSGRKTILTTSPNETLLRYRKDTESDTTSETQPSRLYFPCNATRELPESALKWLRKAKLTNEEIKKYHFTYTPNTDRLILPVFDKGNLIYYQARNLGVVTKDNPKYLNIRAKGAKNVVFTVKEHEKEKTIIIVEDIISAIKVGRHCHSVALLGSYLPDSIYGLLNDYDKIVIWLDRDKLSTSIDMAKKIRLKTARRVKVVSTEEDPKYVDDSTIEGIFVNHG